MNVASESPDVKHFPHPFDEISKDFTAPELSTDQITFRAETSELSLRNEADDFLANFGVISQTERDLAVSARKVLELSSYNPGGGDPPKDNSNNDSSTRRLQKRKDNSNNLPSPQAPYHDFNRGSQALERCQVVGAMAIKGKSLKAPDLVFARLRCACWKCQECGPKHREAWFKSLSVHFSRLLSTGQTLYLSWLDDTPWPATYMSILRHRPSDDHAYARIRHEDGETLLITTSDIGGTPIPSHLVPYVLSKCLERVDLGKRPVTTSRSWYKILPEKRKSFLVGLGVVLKADVEKKAQEVAYRTKGIWTRLRHGAFLVTDFDPAWNDWHCWGAMITHVIGIRPPYDDDHKFKRWEARLRDLWEHFDEDFEPAPVV